MPDLRRGLNEELDSYEARLRRHFSDRQITAEQYFCHYSEENTKLYLSRDDPRSQSGHSGDAHWRRHVRSMILEPILSDGTFIDVGCANGHLIESLHSWMSATDVKVQFYGLELSKGLYDLAVQRLPEFASRLFLGNALYWKPPFTFDYVYTMILQDIPKELQKEFLENLFENYLSPGGRLILGPWNNHGLEAEITAMGFRPMGYCEKSFEGKSYACKRLVWIDKAPSLERRDG